jgi:DNA primase large subunit
MGKAAKAHRAKVAKRNANLKVQEKRMQKVWQEAFQEQMEKMKEQFALMSGDTMSELTGLLGDEENVQEETTQEESESVEPVQGE